LEFTANDSENYKILCVCGANEPILSKEGFFHLQAHFWYLGKSYPSSHELNQLVYMVAYDTNQIDEVKFFSPNFELNGSLYELMRVFLQTGFL
jgi:hypothetical protein